MAVKTNSELAAFFNTGDQPSETEFGHLIDTIQPPHITLGDENKSLTVADHAFRPLIMPNIAGARTLTLPTAEADVWFHIIHNPMVAEAGGHNLNIKSTDNTNWFSGTILSVDSDNNTTAAVFANVSATPASGDDDVISLITSSGCDIWIWGKSATVWYVWGWATSVTQITATNA